MIIYYKKRPLLVAAGIIMRDFITPHILLCTSLDDLSQLSQLELKKLGQPKANKQAMSQLPQLSQLKNY